MAEAETAGIRVATVLGTARPGNYTSKALALVVDEFRKHKDVALDLIDPGRIDLPLPGADPDSPETERLKQTVSRATGLVFATPEYHGSFSSVAKLIIENLGFPSVLATKPVALLGVAAGQIGAIKSLEQLRSVLSHVGAIVLPGPVSVAGVQGVFDEDGRCGDPEIETRIRGVATQLIDYIRGNICPRLALEEMVRREVERRVA